MNVLKHKIICERSKKALQAAMLNNFLDMEESVCARKETNGEQRAVGALVHSRICFICKNEAGIAKGEGKKVWSSNR